MRSPIRKALSRLVNGNAAQTKVNCLRFVSLLPVGAASRPKVLVIGVGTRGVGTSTLWSGNIDRIGIDIYESDTVDYVADAHYLPFRDQLFDGVWIQAVPEHVVSPQKVVDEIERVVKQGGVVYSETPFGSRYTRVPIISRASR